MKIVNAIKTLALSATLSTLPLVTPPIIAQPQSPDTFEKATFPKGTTQSSILANAPSPNVIIQGQPKRASMVVDLNSNILYKYDETGTPIVAYSVASGKKSTPTSSGIRIVTHIEKYPYKSAPRSSKRRKHPIAYGPYIVCLNKLDPKTGAQSSTGEFIHGNNNPASIGTYASKGCIRMDNEIIKEIAANAKRGDIVIMKR